MKKVLITINNNTLGFSYKTNNSKIDNNLINTNIISENELIFSDIYINENLNILSSFIKELMIQYHLTKVSITKIELTPLITKLLTKADSIEEIYIKDDEPITYEICEALINNKHIKSLNCYTIQPFMLELLDNNHIHCISRSEILYMSNFMEKNNLLQYSNIYYKTNIRITFPLSLEDIKDFEDFCKINKYLKVIHVNKLINAELESLINILVKNNRHNLRIIIHENINNEKTIHYLKDKNKMYRKKYRISMSLEYSKDYLNKNIFKQTIVNTLEVCGLIISSLVVLVITYIGVSNYIASIEVDKIKNNLADVIKNTDPKALIDKKNEENGANINEPTTEEPNNQEEPNETEPPIDNPEEPTELEEPKEPPKNPIKLVSNEDIASLLAVNDEVVGHLKVNNTNVDYPVVKGGDNDYYLDHNINKEKNANGWIFMDYRNDPMNLNQNTIIYGHNMYYSGIMFGTLHKTANQSWYTNPENQIITFNTLYENMEFRIFSIYRVPKTNDYLKVNFKTDAEWQEFIDMITKRSIYNFNVPINNNDQIITLSTCSNNGTKRLVIHAVLTKRPNS